MEQFIQQNLWVIILVLWQIPWKGWALWKASRASDKTWYITLLLLQTLGILDILYIFVFSKRSKVPVEI